MEPSRELADELSRELLETIHRANLGSKASMYSLSLTLCALMMTDADKEKDPRSELLKLFGAAVHGMAQMIHAKFSVPR